jgi:hypothetical protein
MRRFFWAMVILLGITGGSARADLFYQYVTDQSSYTLTAANPTATVLLYLQEKITTANSDPSTPTNQSLLGNDGGLGAAGVYVKTTSSGLATISAVTANIGTALGQTNGTGTNFQSQAVATTDGKQAAISEAVSGSGNPGAGSQFSTQTVSSTTINMVLLGSLTITAGSTNGTASYTISELSQSPGKINGQNIVGSGSIGNTVTEGLNQSWTSMNQGNDLDITNNAIFGGLPPTYTGTADDGFFTFSVVNNANTTSTPEPGSMALCGFAACGLGFGAWRRRKAKAAELVAEVPAVA